MKDIRRKLEGCKAPKISNGPLSDPIPASSPLMPLPTLSQQQQAVNPPAHASSSGSAVSSAMSIPPVPSGTVGLTAVLAAQIATLKRQLGLE